ncbi:hypothetical protein IT412_03760 [Candidatus Peregrinibacteria bacterium]|nr:hypothetical protein [Candidatus Peregrinibacteria bacterium]
MTKEESPFFKDNLVRRIWHNNEWWFVIEDLLLTLTETINPKKLLWEMRQRDLELDKNYRKLTCILEYNAKNQSWAMDCTNIEGFFRIVQSINAPKAESFKLWLAKLGKNRVDELSENT